MATARLLGLRQVQELFLLHLTPVLNTSIRLICCPSTPLPQYRHRYGAGTAPTKWDDPMLKGRWDLSCDLLGPWHQTSLWGHPEARSSPLHGGLTPRTGPRQRIGCHSCRAKSYPDSTQSARGHPEKFQFSFLMTLVKNEPGEEDDI